jgi:hypothetical protein
VASYRDEPSGTMLEDVAGAGRFVAISLKPVVTIALGGD